MIRDIILFFFFSSQNHSGVDPLQLQGSFLKRRGCFDHQES
jgi:hypothetical protein